MTELTLETITALAKRRGFVYPTSEIYGGLASSYDYGPLGCGACCAISRICGGKR